MAFKLTDNSYGKSKVRLTKVVRDAARHELYEFDVDVVLRGDFAAAYEVGDNRQVVATDTIKNIVYVVAKTKKFASPEEFAQLLALHFTTTYPQVESAEVRIDQTCWRRIVVAGREHDHAFTREGNQCRTAEAKLGRLDGLFPTVGGVRGLEVIKTTGSEWRDFHSDGHRTLRDASDRILATTIDARWSFYPGAKDHNGAYARATRAMLETFAASHSLGAQHTIKAMGDALLSACGEIDHVSFVLPNQHRIPFNLEPFGLKFENDIFVATSEPFGEIQGTVTRS